MNEEKGNELQLSVSKLELGTLATNAVSIRDKVKSLLPKYDAKNYDENTIEKAKEDKALLNNTSKTLNDERIKLEKQFMQPFIDDFKSIVDETVTMIKEASTKIDVIVKDVETKAKETRKATVTIIFDELVGELKELITIDLIFDDKWLNKGSFNDNGEFKCTKELEDKLNKIRTELEAIKNLKSEHELALTNQYLKDFNLGQVIIENNRLNDLEVVTQKVEVAKEEIKQETIQTMVTEKVVSEADDPIKTYTLKITGELSKMEALLKFLQLNKMHTENAETGEVKVD